MDDKQKNFNPDKTFGGRLHNLRKEKGLSQTELAKLLNYKTSASISNIESDKTPPDIQSLIKIAEILKTDLHWLITGFPSPETKKWESNYYQALDKITKFLAKQLVCFLEEKEHLQSQLVEEEGKKNRGEKVEEEFIDILKSQIRHIESDLQELSREQPWIKQALMAVEIFKKVEQIPPKTLRKMATKNPKKP